MQVICEASRPLPREDSKSDYQMRRSFPARSGSLAVRISVTLVADIAGHCPNLLADLRCGIYERRPLMCRIYPAEINPFTQLDSTKKACPPEAWALEHPVLLRDNRVARETFQADIRHWRNLNEREIHVKRRVCAALNLEIAAIDQEASLVHSPRNDELVEVLTLLQDETDAATILPQWLVVSDQDDSLRRWAEEGANAAHPREVKSGAFQYISLAP